MVNEMKCPNCGSRLIHGGDSDAVDEEAWSHESNLSCNDCGVVVLVLWPHEQKQAEAA